MSKPWHIANSKLYNQTLKEMRIAFPELKPAEVGKKIFFTGPFYLIDEKREIEKLNIELELPLKFPMKIPIVRELEGKIKRGRDFHTFEDGSHCLFAPGERWKYWPQGSSLVDFMNGPVRSFYISALHKNLVGVWPFGDRSHYASGIYEAYTELLGLHDEETIKNIIYFLAHKQLKSHCRCPCGNGKNIRNCHGESIKEWRNKISMSEAQEALKFISKR